MSQLLGKVEREVYCRANTSLPPTNEFVIKSTAHNKKTEQHNPSNIIKLIEINDLNNKTDFSKFSGTYFPEGYDITIFIFKNTFFVKQKDIEKLIDIPSTIFKSKLRILNLHSFLLIIHLYWTY